jgi:hypothetical protein
MDYFLEVSIARDVLGAFEHLDLDGCTARLIQYAVFDA